MGHICLPSVSAEKIPYCTHTIVIGHKKDKEIKQVNRKNLV